MGVPLPIKQSYEPNILKTTLSLYQPYYGTKSVHNNLSSPVSSRSDQLEDVLVNTSNELNSIGDIGRCGGFEFDPTTNVNMSYSYNPPNGFNIFEFPEPNKRKKTPAVAALLGGREGKGEKSHKSEMHA